MRQSSPPGEDTVWNSSRKKYIFPLLQTSSLCTYQMQTLFVGRGNLPWILVFLHILAGQALTWVFSKLCLQEAVFRDEVISARETTGLP